MPRFLHTADWHLGRTFHRTVSDADGQARLRAARFQAVETLGRVAREQGAEAVVVAGDLFHGADVDDRTVVQGLDAIGRIGLPVVAIPGNHDHGGPGGLWDRAVMGRERPRRAPNLTVLRGGPQVHVVAGIALLALPIDEALSAPRLRDLCHLTVPAGLPRVGLIHAPAMAFNEVGTSRTLDATGAGGLGLDFIAMGDFHRQQEVTGLPAPAWYAGTHEPDRFPTHDQAAERRGMALLVDLSGVGAAPIVTPVAIPDTHTWVRLRLPLRGGADLDRLLMELERLRQGRALTTLCQLDLEGSLLGCAERALLDRALAEASPGYLVLEATGSIQCQPTDAELAALTERPGVIGSVATSLAAQATATGSSSDIARAALVRLHLLATTGRKDASCI